MMTELEQTANTNNDAVHKPSGIHHGLAGVITAGDKSQKGTACSSDNQRQVTQTVR